MQSKVMRQRKVMRSLCAGHQYGAQAAHHPRYGALLNIAMEHFLIKLMEQAVSSS
jgi:hypothetical protein